MKKYLLFGGDNYYPSGGWYDFVEDFEELWEIYAHIKTAQREAGWDWAHIVDRDTKEIFLQYKVNDSGILVVK